MRTYNATYKGFPCVVRLVEDHRGDTVVTKRGNIHARPGDYVAVGVDEAPPGFRGQTIDRVVRRDDRSLILGEEIVTVLPVKDRPPTLDEIEAERENAPDLTPTDTPPSE